MQTDFIASFIPFFISSFIAPILTNFAHSFNVLNIK